MTTHITTHGSTGCTHSLIWLEIALQEADQTVRFAISRPSQPDVEAACVPRFQIPPD